MSNAADTRNFVIAGHAGSGKSTLCDVMLFKAKAVARLGSVDSHTSVSDFMSDEQERGASIYSSSMNCVWKDHAFFFTDTPGYGEFIGRYVAAVATADAALVVLDAVDGPQIGTARAWKLSKEQGIPRFGFVNRLDRDRADFKATLEQMRKNHGKTVVIPLTWPVGKEKDFSRVINVLYEKNVPPEIADDVAECRGYWLDAIAETDDELMSLYLDGKELSDEEIAIGLRKTILSGRTIPVFSGSCAKDIGILELMDAIAELLPGPMEKASYKTASGTELPISENGDAIGIVFKCLNDPFSGQLAFLRVVSGTFRADTDVYNLSRGKQKERFGSLLFMNGKNQTPVKEAGPGAVFAVAKLKDSHIGDTLSINAEAEPLPPIRFPGSVMSYAITAAKSGDDEKIMVGLQKIAECEPTVRMYRDPETHEFLLSGMGDQHLAIVAKRMKDQFKTEMILTTPKIAYRETITSSGEGHYRHKKQTGGAGQFAEVYLKISPIEKGVEFVNEVVGGSIPKNFIPAVEKGVMEMIAKGPLVGCTVEKVRVAVYDGKYHPVDSNEMAFKIAGRMAFREAVKQAKPVLLEPVMRVNVHIPASYMGDVTGGLNHKRGRILGMSVEEGMEVVQAEVPLAEMHKYATELRSMTQGRGSFEMEFSRYEQVPAMLADDIIAKHQTEEEEQL